MHSAGPSHLQELVSVRKYWLREFMRELFDRKLPPLQISLPWSSKLADCNVQTLLGRTSEMHCRFADRDESKYDKLLSCRATLEHSFSSLPKEVQDRLHHIVRATLVNTSAAYGTLDDAVTKRHVENSMQGLKEKVWRRREDKEQSEEAGRKFLLKLFDAQVQAAIVIQRAFRAFKHRCIQKGTWPDEDAEKLRLANMKYLDGGAVNWASKEHTEVTAFAQSALTDALNALQAVERLEQRAREGVVRPPRHGNLTYKLNDPELRLLLLGKTFVQREQERSAAEALAGSVNHNLTQYERKDEDPAAAGVAGEDSIANTTSEDEAGALDNRALIHQQSDPLQITTEEGSAPNDLSNPPTATTSRSTTSPALVLKLPLISKLMTFERPGSADHFYWESSAACSSLKHRYSRPSSRPATSQSVSTSSAAQLSQSSFVWTTTRPALSQNMNTSDNKHQMLTARSESPHSSLKRIMTVTSPAISGQQQKATSSTKPSSEQPPNSDHDNHDHAVGDSMALSHQQNMMASLASRSCSFHNNTASNYRAKGTSTIITVQQLQPQNMLSSTPQ
ncbi:hypothetical protein CEUSTIGMA_g4408.t1 [Chlamydomonas eustigma]|uniref:Uncharacterized protein n=1 Tax=Chlamydomonas eustigma TaxID=1157962 RepID=A0A250X1L1_9CHLO|nr:hypothetical protein CEUSTIGMA_g4408.t1 [Chlamydomonas eustigma]|eukprot:GAX76961.1 hypothetical protein CEUSTIGMA_g4408.t1 [Chlamydomonas eustigma]